MQTWIILTLASALLPLAFVGKLLAGLGRNRRLLRQGVPAMATILGLRETNTFVNNRPVMKVSLRVEAPGVAPYDTEASVVAPFSALGMLRPGARVGVRIDPSSPATVAVDLTQLGIAPSAA